MASATSASFWAVAGGAGTRGISFLVFLLIARLLSPADMGVMAIAMAFALFLDAVNELGLPDQVVRFKGDEAKAKSVYAGVEALSPEDIAESILWCLDRPQRVNIQELVIYPTAQAAPREVFRT